MIFDDFSSDGLGTLQTKMHRYNEKADGGIQIKKKIQGNLKHPKAKIQAYILSIVSLFAAFFFQISPQIDFETLQKLQKMKANKRFMCESFFGSESLILIPKFSKIPEFSPNSLKSLNLILNSLKCLNFKPKSPKIPKFTPNLLKIPKVGSKFPTILNLGPKFHKILKFKPKFLEIL